MIATDVRLERFRRFNELGGKFRVAVTGRCNLRCFFCHNEGMGPLGTKVPTALDDATLVAIASAYARLGGKQINVTGGEPLLRPDLPDLLGRIEKGGARLVLNSNGLLAARLLERPRLEALDTILVSLHTLDDEVFARDLGGKSTAQLTRAILALRDHGYAVKLNLSLGPHNAAGVEDVVRFAAAEGLDLKVIALVRPTDAPGFYHGEWVDPSGLERALDALGQREGTREQLGGSISAWRLPRSTVEVKNIARGRLRTDFCRGCAFTAECGEGIYGLRIGVDGWARPCLLRRDAFVRLDPARAWEEQLLDLISAMVGDLARATFQSGAPR